MLIKFVNKFNRMNSEIYCYSDGANRHNGKPNSCASIGVCIIENDVEILTHSEYLGHILDIGPIIDSKMTKIIITNNSAEYLAFIKGIELLIENEKTKNVTFLVDSKLICEQINGNWKVKHPLLKKLYKYAYKLLENFDNYKVIHILRHLNKRADELANDAF